MTRFKCSGFILEEPDFGDAGRRLFFQQVDVIRNSFEEHLQDLPRYFKKSCQKHFCKLGRFSDDDDVLGRIQSATSESDFLQNSRLWILAGLLDAGEAEHYYRYEKDYGGA